ELVERLAQLIHEPLDFLVARAFLQRFRQIFLRLAQATLGLGEIAILEAKGGVPELIDDALEAIAALVAHEPPVGATQADVGAVVREKALGLGGDRVEAYEHLITIARILDEVTPLLDHGARNRVL